jgi:hypothetical protein
MQACIKCGYELANSNDLSCPKCGVVFEKIRKAINEKKTNAKIARNSVSAMHSEGQARTHTFDWEYGVEQLADKKEYGVLGNLSFGIWILTIVAICIDALGLIYLNNNLYWMPDKERYYILVAVGVSVLCGAAAFISIAVFLNMSKELAKNTWMTKELLKQISEQLRG